eukprot:scaffold8030_cov62-Attheya_sp.AAC.3
MVVEGRNKAPMTGDDGGPKRSSWHTSNGRFRNSVRLFLFRVRGASGVKRLGRRSDGDSTPESHNGFGRGRRFPFGVLKRLEIGGLFSQAGSTVCCPSWVVSSIRRVIGSP